MLDIITYNEVNTNDEGDGNGEGSTSKLDISLFIPSTNLFTLATAESLSSEDDMASWPVSY